MTAAAPSGVVTFLFTDIEGSTRRWETDADGMRAALAAHAKASMTLDVYADLFDDDLDSVAESLDSAIVQASSAAIVAISDRSPAPRLLPQGV